MGGQVDPNSPDDQKGPWTCRVLTEPATSKVPCTCNLDDNSQLNRWSVGDQGSWTACRGGKMGCCTSSGLPCGDDDSTTGQLTTQPTSQPTSGPTAQPENQVCSDAGKGCLNTGCCNDKSLTCFKKNDGWADCKPACEAGASDPNSPDDHKSPWSCDVLTK